MGEPVTDERTPWARWALFMVLVAFALYNAVTHVRGRGGKAKVAVGAPAPEVAVPLLSGGKAYLSPVDGEVVMLDFWATWCRPCVKSMPKLLEVNRRLRGRPFRLVLVNQDFGGGDRLKLLQEFPRAHGVQGMSVAVDPGDAAIAWGVQRLPYLVIIDGRGVVRHQWTGGVDADSIVDMVDALVREGG